MGNTKMTLMPRRTTDLKTRTLHKKMTLDSVKLCALCGALNHKNNGECWTCRWHGAFLEDLSLRAMAWQRLEHQFEEVRMEHVTSRRLPALDEWGAPCAVSGWGKLKASCQKAWTSFHTARDLRMAQRDARLRSRSASKP